MPSSRRSLINSAGFTLIELSIVLVIIGLIVGGIVVGQDLIKAAEVRAQVSQIEKLNQAVNTFRGKYGGVPGDLAVSTASQYGFDIVGCDGVTQSMRNGDGIIDGYQSPYVLDEGLRETYLFWKDLSYAGLIEGTFPNGGVSLAGCTKVAASLNAANAGNYFPPAKIGHGNFVYVYENAMYNWFGVSSVSATVSGWSILSNTTIPVIQAYNMDKKIDDGLPMSGSVIVAYINGADGNVPLAYAPGPTSDSPTSCYNTTSNTYSISSLTNYGGYGNCALSFRFQ